MGRWATQNQSESKYIAIIRIITFDFSFGINLTDNAIFKGLKAHAAVCCANKLSNGINELENKSAYHKYIMIIQSTFDEP